MTRSSTLGEVPPSVWVLLGSLLIILGLTTYPPVGALTPIEGAGIERFVVSFAYFALGLDVSGLSMLFYGATKGLARLGTRQESGTLSSVSTMIATVFSESRYPRLLVASSFLYGTFYAVASGIVVFQPALSFSEVYRVAIPSIAVATCCGPVGQTPQMVAYVSQHLGLVVIPLNLLLLFSISWLVGLNASFARFVLSIRTRKVGIGWLGGIGAFLGLFTSCPTCAGLVVISLLGGTAGLSTSFILGPLQAIFVVVSIPILIATPLISARSLRNFNGRTCPRS